MEIGLRKHSPQMAPKVIKWLIIYLLLLFIVMSFRGRCEDGDDDSNSGDPGFLDHFCDIKED